MKFVRYAFNEKVAYGILDGEVIREINSGLFGERKETGGVVELKNAQLLCPCEPTKILAIGFNYRSHLSDQPAPKNPEIFVVPTSAMLEPGGVIRIPSDATNVHYEGELAVIIGKKARNVSPVEADDCIFGCCCGNDVSEREWQKNDLQWWRAKGCDTFAPLGPAVVEGFNWREGRVETRVNGGIVQSGKFSELLFDPPAIISFVSRHMTLFPGDVVFTGTPGTTMRLKPGDFVEVEIPGIGVLQNTVQKGDAPHSC
jgi:2-keto-4-pentenoate hydratase/2-oxohepta-3-ene-1,7-dioic acid hydratase in catechol pathway